MAASNNTETSVYSSDDKDYVAVSAQQKKNIKMVWAFSNEDCAIGLKTSDPNSKSRRSRKNHFIYEFSLFNNEEASDTFDFENFPEEIEIRSGNEVYPPLRHAIINYFTQDSSLNMNTNSEEASDQIDTIKRKRSFSECREFLEENAGEEIDKSKEDIIQLLLMQKLLQAISLSADPSIVKGLSNTEQKDIKLYCFVLRMYTLNLLFKNHEMGDYQELRENVKKAYIEEFKRFCEYLSEESFYRYILPNYISAFFQRLWNKKELQVDDIVFGTIEEFTKIISFDQTLKKYISKVINGFLLPRYNILGCWKLQRLVGTNWIDLFNILLLPRLTASIIIGLLPVLLTGELYEWYKSEILDDAVAEIVFFSFTFILLIVVLGYLCIETHNFLGFYSFKSAGTIFLLGLFMSVIFVLIAHPFSCYTLKNGCKNITDLPRLLLFFQTTASYFLGIVLQAIWEDKPITQPL